MCLMRQQLDIFQSWKRKIKLSKLEKLEVLVKAIRKVHAGEVWMNRAMMASAVTQIQTRRSIKADPIAAKIASLTVRELDIIGVLGEGRLQAGPGLLDALATGRPRCVVDPPRGRGVDEGELTCHAGHSTHGV